MIAYLTALGEKSTGKTVSIHRDNPAFIGTLQRNMIENPNIAFQLTIAHTTVEGTAKELLQWFQDNNVKQWPEWQEIVGNVKVYGLEESIKRAKYPKSTNIKLLNSELTNGIQSLAQSAKGSGHDQFLTGIVVQFDLTFTIKAWTEAERYHFLDFISSQSTMHRITKFDLDQSYINYVDSRIIDIIKEKVELYNSMPEELEEAKKEAYLEILYSNPCGMQLTAGMTTNYRQLKTIYSQRKTHRLPEWRAFCAWIETLPMAQELIIS